MSKDETLGHIKITNNCLVLGDPFYLPQSEGQTYRFEPVPNGTFRVMADRHEDGKLGRVLVVFHQEEFEGADPDFTERMDSVGVDSGMLSVFDGAVSDGWTEDDKKTLEARTADVDVVAVPEEASDYAGGIVFATGVGDGLFPVFWWYGEEAFEEYEHVAAVGLIIREDFSPI